MCRVSSSLPLPAVSVVVVGQLQQQKSSFSTPFLNIRTDGNDLAATTVTTTTTTKQFLLDENGASEQPPNHQEEQQQQQQPSIKTINNNANNVEEVPSLTTSSASTTEEEEHQQQEQQTVVVRRNSLTPDDLMLNGSSSFSFFSCHSGGGGEDDSSFVTAGEEKPKAAATSPLSSMLFFGNDSLGCLSLAESTLALLPHFDELFCCAGSGKDNAAGGIHHSDFVMPSALTDCFRPFMDDDLSSPNEQEPYQTLYAYVACSIKAAAHCADLGRWKETHDYAKKAIDCMGGLDRILGKVAVSQLPAASAIGLIASNSRSTHQPALDIPFSTASGCPSLPTSRSLQSNSNNASANNNATFDLFCNADFLYNLFCDQRYAEWRVKAVLLMARSLARLQDTRQSIHLLRHARSMIQTQMLPNSTINNTTSNTPTRSFATPSATPTAYVCHPQPCPQETVNRVQPPVLSPPTPTSRPAKIISLDQYYQQIRQKRQAQEASRLRQEEMVRSSTSCSIVTLPPVVDDTKQKELQQRRKMFLRSMSSMDATDCTDASASTFGGDSVSLGAYSAPLPSNSRASLLFRAQESMDFSENSSSSSSFLHSPAPSKTIFKVKPGQGYPPVVTIPCKEDHDGDSSSKGSDGLAPFDETVRSSPKPTLLRTRSSLRAPKTIRPTLQRRVTFSPDVAPDDDARELIKAFVSPKIMSALKQKQQKSRSITYNNVDTTRQHSHRHHRHTATARNSDSDRRNKRSSKSSSRSKSKKIPIHEILAQELERELKNLVQKDSFSSTSSSSSTKSASSSSTFSSSYMKKEKRQDETVTSSSRDDTALSGERMAASPTSPTSSSPYWSRSSHLVKKGVYFAAGMLFKAISDDGSAVGIHT